ncbi:hypothetical protein [Cupriavidus necator]|uniref:hypothetical protein n=1 Tax=Cupriavidus necator TaxID=106590 RepID=UPI0005B46984|nr:hypothetical protein [Cupriavidus necator]
MSYWQWQAEDALEHAFRKLPEARPYFFNKGLQDEYAQLSVVLNKCAHSLSTGSQPPWHEIAAYRTVLRMLDMSPGRDPLLDIVDDMVASFEDAGISIYRVKE